MSPIKFLLCAALLASVLNAPAAIAASSEADYTQLLEDAGTKAQDGREALAVLTVLASRQGSASAVDALRELVLAASAEDALLIRHALANDGTLVRDTERAQQLIEKLNALDPGNANNGLSALSLDPADVASTAVATRLKAIAAAPRYVSDFAAMVQAGHRVLSRVTWPDDLIAQAKSDAGTSPAMVVSVSIAAAVASPNFEKLVNACNQQSFPDRANDCQQIGQRILNGALTMVDQLVGAAVLDAAAHNDASRADAIAAQRRVQWQSEQATQLISSPPGVAAGTDREAYSADVLTKGELAAVHALFARKKVALEPPVDWTPSPEPEAESPAQ